MDKKRCPSAFNSLFFIFVGDRCSIFPISKCRAAFDVYFYNVSAGKCQHMIAGGCHPSGWNGFFLENDCKNYCERGMEYVDMFLVKLSSIMILSGPLGSTV